MRNSDLRRVDVADVYRGDALAGELRRTDDGTQFTYSAKFLADRPFGDEGVSWTMPPSEMPYLGHGESLPRFFANLAPEGGRLAATVGRLHTSPDDLMTVLLAVGRDCVGDVRVVPSGSPLELPRARAVPDIGDADFEELFWEAVGGETIDPTALPGMQDKASGSVVSFPAKIGFGNSPTIIKISPKAFPLLVENEAFFLGVAQRAGIDVNEWRLVRDRTGRSGLVVKRFDRVASGRAVKLVHQEDGCQLLERYPWQKYRVKMSELTKAVQERATSPQRETMRLLVLYAFSYLIGNADMHAKNVSMLLNPETGVVELTPGYDLLSTLPYSGLDTRMAISLDGRDDKFKAKSLLEFGERWEVRASALSTALGAVVAAVEVGLERLGDVGFEGPERARLELTMSQRLKQFGL